MALGVAEQSPRKPAAIQHYNQALAYYRSGQLEQAIREFEAALRIEPGSTTIRTGLGWAYERQGHRHQAILEWQRAAKAGSPLARQALAGAGVGMERASLRPSRAFFGLSAAVVVLVVGLLWGLMPTWLPVVQQGLSQLALAFPSVQPVPTTAVVMVATATTAYAPTRVPPTQAPISVALPTDTTEAIAWATTEPTQAPRGGNTVYVVQPGDTLWAIAAKFGTTVQAIMALNGLTGDVPLMVGQQLLIPTQPPEMATLPPLQPTAVTVATALSGQIVFSSSRTGTSELYVMNADGSNVRQLTNDTRSLYAFWSPDGQQLAVVSQQPDNTYQISVMNADGSNPRLLTSGPNSSIIPAWSTNGQQIAYVSSGAGESTIYVINTDGTGLHRLTQVTFGSERAASWSPDGQHLVYMTAEGTRTHIYTINYDGYGVTQLTELDGDPALVTWSPDGAHIGFLLDTSGSNNNYQIYVMNADGSNVQRLTNTATSITGPSWTPDGQHLLYASNQDGPWQVYMMDVDGSNVRRLTHDTADYLLPDLQPSGVSIAYASVTEVPATAAATVELPTLAFVIPTEVPPTVAPTFAPPTEVPPTLGPGHLTGSGTCVPEQGMVIYMISNTGQSPITANYIVTDTGSIARGAGTLDLQPGETTTISVDVRGQAGTYLLNVPAQQFTLQAMCALPTNTPAPATNTPLPTTSTPLPTTPAPGQPALSAGFNCAADGRSTVFTIVDSNAPMTADTVYMITDSSSKMQKAGAFRLAQGESTTLTVDLSGVTGALTLYVPDFMIKVTATCAPAPTSVVPATVAPTITTPPLLGACRESGDLVVGTDASYPPFESVNTDTNQIEGFDIDLLNAIGARLGFRPVYQNTLFDTIFTDLAAGKFDLVISATTITEERSNTVSFSSPYFISGQVIVVRRADAASIKSMTDLAGKLIGVQVGTTGAETARNVNALDVKGYPTAPEAFQALANGDVDAVISDTALSLSILLSQPSLNLVVTGQPFSNEYYGIAVRKECPQLLARIQDGLTSIINDGTYAIIYMKWMGEEPPEQFRPGQIGFATPLVSTPVAALPPTNTPVPTAMPIPTLAPTQPAAVPGGLIAFSLKQGDHSSIFLANADGSNLRRLTDSNFDEFGAAWSPDGSQIAFLTNTEGHYQVHVVNADGSNLRRLTNVSDSNEIEFLVSWSPDGKQLTFSAYQDSSIHIYVMNADGSNLHRLTNDATNEMGGVWSPDGQQIAFSSGRDGDNHIYVMNVDGSNLHRLGDAVENTGALAWSPDGQRIVYEVSDVTAQTTQLYIVNADGSNRQMLIGVPGRSASPSWSPDGQHIVFASNLSGQFQIYIMNADGSNPQRLTNQDAEENSPAWMPGPTRVRSSEAMPTTAAPTGTASLSVASSCLANNAVSFTITNSGGAMSAPTEYRLMDSAGTVLTSKTLQLDAGSSMSISGVGDLTLVIPAYAVVHPANCSGSVTVQGGPRLSVSVVCTTDGYANYTVTNSGDSMNAPILYLLTDSQGASLSANAIQLDKDNSTTITGPGDSTLHIPMYSIVQPANCGGAPSGAATATPAALATNTPPAATCTATAMRAANMRSAPKVSAPVMDMLTAGQQIELNGYTQGTDGYKWYRRSDGFWVRADLLTVAGNCNVPAVNP